MCHDNHTYCCALNSHQRSLPNRSSGTRVQAISRLVGAVLVVLLLLAAGRITALVGAYNTHVDAPTRSAHQPFPQSHRFGMRVNAVPRRDGAVLAMLLLLVMAMSALVGVLRRLLPPLCPEFSQAPALKLMSLCSERICAVNGGNDASP